MAQSTASTLSSLFHRMHTVLAVTVCHSFGSLLSIQLREEHSVLLNVLFNDPSRLRFSLKLSREEIHGHCTAVE